MAASLKHMTDSQGRDHVAVADWQGANVGDGALKYVLRHRPERTLLFQLVAD